MNSSQLTTLRNELYDMLPTGKVEAWDMITAVKAMFERFDQVIDQQPSSSGAESGGVKQLLEDFLDYVGGNYTQHGTGDDVYWDRGEGEDRQMNYEGVVEDYLFDYSEFADAVLSLTKSFSAVESAGVLKQKLNDLIELVTDDKLVLHATPINGRPHDPNPEISRLRDEIVAEFSAAAPSSKEREMAISFLDNIRDYERESGNQICYDERTSEELFDLYLESLNKKP